MPATWSEYKFLLQSYFRLVDYCSRRRIPFGDMQLIDPFSADEVRLREVISLFEARINLMKRDN